MVGEDIDTSDWTVLLKMQEKDVGAAMKDLQSKHTLKGLVFDLE